MMSTYRRSSTAHGVLRLRNVLVTGATGFVGGHLTRALLDRGDNVRLLVRPKSQKQAQPFEALGARIVHGDIRDIGSVRDAATGCEVVFHTAALVRGAWTKAEYYANNVDGTDAVIGACEGANVHRLIHVSDQCVVSERRDMHGDESLPYAQNPACPYAETKIAAEQLVRKAHDDGRIVATIARPGWIWGPGDATTLPEVERLANLYLLRGLSRPDALTSTTHVRNLVRGLLLCADTTAAAGETLNLADGIAISPRDMSLGLAAACGTSFGAGLAIPTQFEFFWREAAYLLARIMLSNEAWLNHTFMDMLWYARDFSDEKARAMLGYESDTMLARDMAALAEWAREDRLPWHKRLRRGRMSA